jgi:hypothetical protein
MKHRRGRAAGFCDEDAPEPYDDGPSLFGDDEPALLPPAPPVTNAPAVASGDPAPADFNDFFAAPLAAAPAPPRSVAAGPVTPSTAPVLTQRLPENAEGTSAATTMKARRRGDPRAGGTGRGGQRARHSSPGADERHAERRTSLTVDDVIQVWPHFLTETDRISKRAAIMMAGAVPTAVNGRVITISFGQRPNYEMMSLPKQQEFVRKLLAFKLGRDSVQVRFTLDPGAQPPPRAPNRQKKRVERDLIAAIDNPPALGLPVSDGDSASNTGNDGFVAATVPAAAARPETGSGYRFSAPTPPAAAAPRFGNSTAAMAAGNRGNKNNAAAPEQQRALSGRSPKRSWPRSKIHSSRKRSRFLAASSWTTDRRARTDRRYFCYLLKDVDL